MQQKLSSAPVLFSFSGFSQSGKTSIYRIAEEIIRQSGHRDSFLFLGNVLRKLTHTGEHATTRLLRGWSRLNEACVTHVRPALESGRIVVVDGFGLDVYLNAVTCHDCPQQKQEAFELHHRHLVPARIVTQGIRPPIYLLTRKPHPDNDQVAVFRTREEREIERYFSGTGQNPPFYLEGETDSECAEDAARRILGITARQAALA